MPQLTPYVAPDVQLREHGLRITRPRLSVLSVLTARADTPRSGYQAEVTWRGLCPVRRLAHPTVSINEE